MTLPGEEFLNKVVDEHRGLRTVGLSLGVAIFALLGAKIIWPRDSIETLAAQQFHIERRIDSNGFRIDSLKLRLSERNLLGDGRYAELNRQLKVLLVLTCSQQKKTSVAYALADCTSVLAP